jgi:hypothetical protein
MRRVFETFLIIDLYSDTYRQQSRTVKSQIWGVFRDWYVGLKSLSEKGLLHMGVAEAPVCNMDEGAVLAEGLWLRFPLQSMNGDVIGKKHDGNTFDYASDGHRMFSRCQRCKKRGGTDVMSAWRRSVQ